MQARCRQENRTTCSVSCKGDNGYGRESRVRDYGVGGSIGSRSESREGMIATGALVVM